MKDSKNIIFFIFLNLNLKKILTHIHFKLPNKKNLGVPVKKRSLLLSGSEDMTIKVWDLESDSISSLFTLKGCSGGVTDLLTLNDKKTTLVSCSKDKSIRFWSLKQRK